VLDLVKINGRYLDKTIPTQIFLPADMEKKNTIGTTAKTCATFNFYNSEAWHWPTHQCGVIPPLNMHTANQSEIVPKISVLLNSNIVEMNSLLVKITLIYDNVIFKKWLTCCILFKDHMKEVCASEIKPLHVLYVCFRVCL